VVIVRRTTPRITLSVLAASLLIAGCARAEVDAPPKLTGDPSAAVAAVAAASEPVPPPPEPTPIDPADQRALATAVLGAGPCDVLDPTACLLPFPSNHFTVEQLGSATRRRVNLPTGLLANRAGATFDPTEWNRNDGFSPGTPIMVGAPRVDLARSGLPTIGDIGASLQPGSASMLFDLDAGRALAHWTELDTTAPTDAERLLIMHPAAALPQGHRIVVGFSHLRDANGVALEPSLPFRVFRDRLVSADAVLEDIESRRSAMEETISTLATAGLPRAEMFVAWDFQVVSQNNLSGRMLSMRNDAFARLGPAAPAFTVDEVVTDASELEDGITRLVRGTFEVPLFLDREGAPGSRMTYDRLSPNSPQTTGATFTASYSCQVPQVSIDRGAGSARPVIYGHGLLGSHDEVEGGQVAAIASENSMIYCATDWIGLAEGDVGNAVTVLGDISKFPTIADRSQQGMLNALFLGRLMIHPQGLSSNAAFQTTDALALIDGTEAYYDGNSQGAIMGGALTAVAVDWTKAVLGVAGMNYAILLSRSVDFETYFAVLRGAYPKAIDQQILYGLLQMLWDRAEADGYAEFMTSRPLPGTPQHDVILSVAFGDHQVANVTAEMEARTIGASLRTPALGEGRHPDTTPFFGLEAIDRYPFTGSALVYWDTGTLPAPPFNITPVESEGFTAICGPLSKAQRESDVRCADPHEDPRRQPGGRRQKDAFFRPDGVIIDPCDGQPCLSTPTK